MRAQQRRFDAFCREYNEERPHAALGTQVREITGNDKRACLYYDIKLCNAPCIGAVNQEGYRQMISDLMAFLSGHSEDIVRHLESEMEKRKLSMSDLIRLALGKLAPKAPKAKTTAADDSQPKS